LDRTPLPLYAPLMRAYDGLANAENVSARTIEHGVRLVRQKQVRKRKG